MDLMRINPGTVNVLRRRGLSDKELAALSPEEAFNEFCEYQGVLRIAPTLVTVLDNLRQSGGNGKKSPEQAFGEYCEQLNIRRMAPRLISVLDNLRGSLIGQPRLMGGAEAT